MFDLNPSQQLQRELAQIKTSLYFPVLHYFSALPTASTQSISIDHPTMILSFNILTTVQTLFRISYFQAKHQGQILNP